MEQKSGKLFLTHYGVVVHSECGQTTECRNSVSMAEVFHTLECSLF